MGSRPSKVVFLLSFVIGIFAILNKFFFELTFLSNLGITNFILLTVAFVLLLLGVIFKGL